MAMKKENAFENKPDTRGVVHEVHGHAKTGRIAGQTNFNGNSPSRNRMVSANATLKRRA